MMRKLPSKSISSTFAGVSPDKRKTQLFLDKSDDSTFGKWENLARYVKNRFNSNRIISQNDCAINRTPKGGQNQNKYTREKNKLIGSSISKKKTPEPILKTFQRTKERVRDTRGKSLIKDIIGKRKEDGFHKYNKHMTTIGALLDKERSLVSRGGSQESKGKKQNEISATNLSHLRVSQNLRSSAFTGAKEFQEQKFLNSKIQKKLSGNDYHGHHQYHSNTSSINRNITSSNRNSGYNNFSINKSELSGTIGHMSMQTKASNSGNKPQVYMNGIAKKIKEDAPRLGKIEAKGGTFDYFNSSSDRNLASSLNFNVTSPKNMNYLMNDKKVSYNSKLKQLGKFSCEKNSMTTVSNFRESLNNESAFMKNGKHYGENIMNNDYFGELIDETDKSIEKSYTHSNHQGIINLDTKFDINNDLNYDRINNMYSSPASLKDCHHLRYDELFLTNKVKHCVKKFTEKYFENQKNYSSKSCENYQIKENDNQENDSNANNNNIYSQDDYDRMKIVEYNLKAKIFAIKTLARKLVNQHYLKLKICLFKLCENSIYQEQNNIFDSQNIDYTFTIRCFQYSLKTYFIKILRF